jgi:hypothetical protein
MPSWAWKASSVVCAGENVLDSIPKPAIAILGIVREDLVLQLKSNEIIRVKRR